MINPIPIKSNPAETIVKTSIKKREYNSFAFSGYKTFKKKLYNFYRFDFCLIFN